MGRSKQMIAVFQSRARLADHKAWYPAERLQAGLLSLSPTQSQVILASAFIRGRLCYPNFTPVLPGNYCQLNRVRFLSVLRQGMWLVVALPSNKIAVRSLFCARAV